MTGLKDLLTNFRIINGGYVAFAGDKKGGKMIGQGEYPMVAYSGEGQLCS